MCVRVCVCACVRVCVCECVTPLPVQVKKGGGMSINSTVTLTKMSERMAQLILHEYSILLTFTATLHGEERGKGGGKGREGGERRERGRE